MTLTILPEILIPQLYIFETKIFKHIFMYKQNQLKMWQKEII
jgi:hypothetical protein